MYSWKKGLILLPSISWPLCIGKNSQQGEWKRKNHYRRRRNIRSVVAFLSSDGGRTYSLKFSQLFWKTPAAKRKRKLWKWDFFFFFINLFFFLRSNSRQLFQFWNFRSIGTKIASKGCEDESSPGFFSTKVDRSIVCWNDSSLYLYPIVQDITADEIWTRERNVRCWRKLTFAIAASRIDFLLLLLLHFV